MAACDSYLIHLVAEAEAGRKPAGDVADTFVRWAQGDPDRARALMAEAIRHHRHTRTDFDLVAPPCTSDAA